MRSVSTATMQERAQELREERAQLPTHSRKYMVLTLALGELVRVLKTARDS